MSVPLYLDVHVPHAIADQLRRRGVDVVTAIEDGCDLLPDDELLEKSSSPWDVSCSLRTSASVHWPRTGNVRAVRSQASPSAINCVQPLGVT